MSESVIAKKGRLFRALQICLSDQRTTKNDCAVYACLLAHSRGFISRPSRVRIAQEAGINSINVSRHTRKLVDLEYIKVKHTAGFNTNVYELLPARGMGVTADTPDMGVIPARVQNAPETPEKTADMGITADTQYRVKSKGKSAPSTIEQSGVGRSPPKRANRPGAEAGEPRQKTKPESRSSAVAFGSPGGGFKYFQSQSFFGRQGSQGASAAGNDDDLIAALKREFGIRN